MQDYDNTQLPQLNELTIITGDEGKTNKLSYQLFLKLIGNLFPSEVNNFKLVCILPDYNLNNILELLLQLKSRINEEFELEGFIITPDSYTKLTVEFEELSRIKFTNSKFIGDFSDITSSHFDKNKSCEIEFENGSIFEPFNSS